MEGVVAGAAACFFTGAVGAAAQLLWGGRKRRRVVPAQNAEKLEADAAAQAEAEVQAARQAEAEEHAQAEPQAEAAQLPQKEGQSLLPLMPALKAPGAAPPPITPATAPAPAPAPAAAPPLTAARGLQPGSPMEADEDGVGGSAGPGEDGGSEAQRTGQGGAEAGRRAAEAAAAVPDSGTDATGSPRGTLLGSQLADSHRAATAGGTAATSSDEEGGGAAFFKRQRQQAGAAQASGQRVREQAQASGSTPSIKGFKRLKPKAHISGSSGGAHEGTKLGGRAAATAAAAAGVEGGTARAGRGPQPGHGPISARQPAQGAGKRKATAHGRQELSSLQLFAWDKNLQEQPLGREMQAVEQHIDEGLAAGEEEGQEGGDPARGRQAVHGRRAYATRHHSDMAGDGDDDDDDDDVEILD